MYRAIVAFADSCDDGYVYRTGDTYPREGLEPTAERIIELTGTANGRGFPVIEEVQEAVKAEPVAEPEPEVEPEESKETAEPEEKAEEAAEERKPARSGRGRKRNAE